MWFCRWLAGGQLWVNMVKNRRRLHVRFTQDVPHSTKQPCSFIVHLIAQSRKIVRSLDDGAQLILRNKRNEFLITWTRTSLRFASVTPIKNESADRMADEKPKREIKRSCPAEAFTNFCKKLIEATPKYMYFILASDCWAGRSVDEARRRKQNCHLETGTGSDMALRLHNARIADGGFHCFTFIVEQFSNVSDAVFSKPFFFGGHRWRLQGGVKEGQFGVFLRWMGGGEYSANTKCTIKFGLEIQNVLDPSKSVYVGSMDEEDEFAKVGFGSGWSRLISEKEIRDPCAGFLDGDCIYVELRCQMVQTLFEQNMVVNVSAGTHSVASSQFSLYGNEWSIVLFPRGEPKAGHAPQYDNAAIYLHRVAVSPLRFKMTFSLFVKGKKEVQITHHFCDNELSTTFGVEKFMRHRELKAFAKGGTATIGVKITSVEPYFYLGLDTKEWKPPDTMGEPCAFEDYTLLPMSLHAGCSEDEKLMLKLMFDPESKHNSLDSSAYYMKILWTIRVFCLKQFDKSITMNSWDVIGRSSFCYSQDEMSVTLPLQLSEVCTVSLGSTDSSCQSGAPFLIGSLLCVAAYYF